MNYYGNPIIGCSLDRNRFNEGCTQRFFCRSFRTVEIDCQSKTVVYRCIYCCLSLYFLCLFFLIITVAPCSNGEIQLSGSLPEYQGLIEVCVNNSWATICTDNFDANNAMVVCRQLGYSPSGKAFFLK